MGGGGVGGGGVEIEYLCVVRPLKRSDTPKNRKDRLQALRTRQLCKNQGGRPGLPVPNGPYGLLGRKATLNPYCHRGQELCESRGGRPGLPTPLTVLVASVDVKQRSTTATIRIIYILKR